MGEPHNAEEVVEAFKAVDGIDAHVAWDSTLLVKVNDESAIGQFYGLCRRMGGERDHTTRNSSLDTVLDSWYTL